MPSSRIDRAFRRYQRTGDPKALGRVFDVGAPELYRLAWHLTGDRHVAEDMVQTTFLVALQDAGSFARGYKVMPWLCGILTNRVLHWRRQQRTRVDATPRLVNVAGEDPATQVEERDLQENVATAVRRLPEPYRQVLLLHLVHDLAPKDIAEALERPDTTVRVQLRRGLDLLRKVLPVGLAATARAAMPVPVGLSAVRAEVLAKAAAMSGGVGAVVVGSFVIGGMVVNTKASLAVGVAAATLFAVLWGAGVPPFGTPEEAREVAHPTAAVAEIDSGVVGVVEAPGSLQRLAVENAGPPHWQLTVRVHLPDDEPVVGADVDVEFVPNGSDGAFGVEPVAAGRTGPDGAFRCSFDELRLRSRLSLGLSSLRATAQAESSEPRGKLVRLPLTDEPASLTCDLELRPAVRLVGRVVDARGAGVGGARFHGFVSDAPSGSAIRRREQSDADGSFCLFGRPGSWPVAQMYDDRHRDEVFLVASAASLGTAVVPMPRLEVPPQPGETVDLGTIVLAPSETVRGRVVLGDGSPLAGYPIDLRAMAGGEPVTVRRFEGLDVSGYEKREFDLKDGMLFRRREQLLTAADGSFAFAGLDPDLRYALGVRDGALQWTLAEAAASEPVRLVLERQLLRIDVRSEQDERLQGANLVAQGWEPGFEHPPREVYPGFPPHSPRVVARFYPLDTEGRRLVLTSFGWIWRISSFDEIARADFVRYEVLTGQHRADLELTLRPEQRFGAVRLSVVDTDGKPVGSFRVNMRCLDRDVARNEGACPASADLFIRDLPLGRWRLDVGVGRLLLPGPLYARGSYEREVEVREGEVSEVRVEVSPAGLVYLNLRADPAHEGSFGVLCVRPAGGGDPIRYFVQHDGKEGPIPVMSVTDSSMLPWGRKLHSGARLILCPAYPVGRHSFVVEAEGCHPASCEVNVEDGKVRRGTVTLFPR